MSRIVASSFLPLALSAFPVVFLSCLNPFAPKLDTASPQAPCDVTTIECLFERFQNAYTFRDTAVYGPMVRHDFVFVYRNYDLNIDVTWGRDEEMRSTYGLFQNAQRLDLIWNNIISVSETDTTASAVRGFNLTVTFNPNDIERIDGYANLSFRRARKSDAWTIVRWRDESNF